MLKQLKNKQSGFTLIEIVIVMAIAGLIMVLVFLGVSGANKARRDTERKNAAARMVAAVEQTASNSSGAYPAACAGINGWNGGGYTCIDAATALSTASVRYTPGVAAGTAKACDGVTAMTTRQFKVEISLEASGTFCQDTI